MLGPTYEGVPTYIPVEQMRDLYNTQGLPKNPVTELFWCPDNLNPLFEKMQDDLTQETGMDVYFLPDESFFDQASMWAAQTPNTPNPYVGVQSLNTQLYEWAMPRQRELIKMRKLFLKYYIYNDHPRYIEPPKNTYGRKRLVRPSSATYYLGDPEKQRYCDYRTFLASSSNSVKIPDMFQAFLRH